jgi:hypothetical protein
VAATVLTLHKYNIIVGRVMSATRIWMTELLFGFNARLTVMLDNWHQFLTRAPGTTIPTLCQLVQADPSAACQLGWFIDRRMQQFLVLCSSGRHKDVIYSTLLDFGATRQQLKDGAFEFKLSEY